MGETNALLISPVKHREKFIFFLFKFPCLIWQVAGEKFSSSFSLPNYPGNSNGKIPRERDHPLRTTRAHAQYRWPKSYTFLKKFNLSFHSLVQYVTLANLIFSTKPIMLPIQMQLTKKLNSSLKYHLLGSNC